MEFRIYNHKNILELLIKSKCINQLIFFYSIKYLYYMAEIDDTFESKSVWYIYSSSINFVKFLKYLILF